MAGHDGGIEDVHACSAVYFLGKDDGEGYGQCEHPEWSCHRNDERYEQSGNEVAFLDFLAFPLGNDELNAESDDIGDNDFWQYGQKTVAEELPKCSVESGCVIVLIADVVHAEEHRREEGDDNEGHDAFRVDGVVDADSYFRCFVRDEQETFHAFEYRVETMQFPSSFEAGPDLVKKLFYHSVPICCLGKGFCSRT